MSTNAFTAASTNLATLNSLVALAERTFGTAEVLAVHTYTHSSTVGVQMMEADLLAWCEAHGLTPSSTVTETDYRPFGGGFVTHRRMEVVVAEVESESGRLVLTSCEEVGRRPATPAAEAEGTKAVA